ncbi:MAG: PQQ-like beta-propeller repeat protein [Bacteroidales bacterium]|nr:PQQ-like beta-propeller repeat protein [Bacteroidales bacterium]
MIPRLLLTLCALSAVAADWPGILGPNRDGHSSETGLNWNWPAAGPPQLWKKAIGAGFAGVSVAGGSVFLFHRIDDQEVLAALDPLTGQEKWTSSAPTQYRDDFNFDPGPRCVPVVADGRVFALGANGDLHAVEAKTGRKLWHRNIRSDYRAPKGYFGVGSTPIVVGERLLVNVGGKGAGIVAFAVATGKELWKATDDPGSYSAPTLAEISGKSRAIFLTRTGLVGLDPATGQVAFTHYFRSRLDASVNGATPLVWKGNVFLTSSYGVGAALFDVTGAEPEAIWENDRSIASQYNTPVRVGDYLYGTDGRADLGVARLRCVEWKTGTVKWTRENYGVAALIAVDGGILAVNENGELIRFDADPERYTERGRAAILRKPTRAIPALSDGLLFCRDEKDLVCVDLRRKP